MNYGALRTFTAVGILCSSVSRLLQLLRVCVAMVAIERERETRTTEELVLLWYSAIFIRVPPDVIYLQLCTLKVVGL
jgi:hypothetical protein